MNMKKIIILASILLVSTSLFAQRDILRYADIEFDLKRFEHAGSQYSKAFNKKKTYYSAKRAAQSYTFIKSYQKAYEWWSKVIAFSETDRSDFIEYARAAILIGKDLKTLNINLSVEERALVYGNIQVPVNNAVEFRPVDRLNKSGSDYGLSTFKSGEYYFVSDRALEEKTEKKSIRLDARKRFSDSETYKMNDRGYHSIFRDTGSGLIAEVKVNLEGVYHLSMPSFFKHGSNQEVVFTAVLKQKSGSQTKTETFPGLYRAQVQQDGSFTDVKGFSFNRQTEYSVMHGTVYENKLYFSSNMPGGNGGFDLYVAEMNGDEIGPAVNLGPKINGPADEVFPFIHNGEIYFSSDRAESLGGLDIYSASLKVNLEVKNMGIPYNSAQDDFAYFVDHSGVKYISSDRGKNESRDDIYSLVFLFDTYKIHVVAPNGESLDGMKDLEIKLFAKDGKDLTQKLKDGKISDLEPGDYALNIRKKGYFTSKMPLNVQMVEGKEKEMTYQLIPIPYKKSIALDTLYYDLDEYTIRSDAAEVLNRTVQLLEEFKDFGLKITSHTDSRASDQYNVVLSKKRSLSASEYLIKKGISEERLSLDWRGKLEPVNTCVDGVECPDVLHEKNRRSILTLDLYPDVNTDYELPIGVNTEQELMEFLKKRIQAVKDSLRFSANPQFTVQNRKSDLIDTALHRDSNLNGAVKILDESDLVGYHLIYESWETESMAVKRAGELMKEINTSVHIIPPTKNVNDPYRLAIAKYQSFDEVNKAINKVRKKYKNNQIWMLELHQ